MESEGDDRTSATLDSEFDVDTQHDTIVSLPVFKKKDHSSHLLFDDNEEADARDANEEVEERVPTPTPFETEASIANEGSGTEMNSCTKEEDTTVLMEDEETVVMGCSAKNFNATLEQAISTVAEAFNKMVSCGSEIEETAEIVCEVPEESPQPPEESPIENEDDIPEELVIVKSSEIEEEPMEDISDVDVEERRHDSQNESTCSISTNPEGKSTNSRCDVDDESTEVDLEHEVPDLSPKAGSKVDIHHHESRGPLCDCKHSHNYSHEDHHHEKERNPALESLRATYKKSNNRNSLHALVDSQRSQNSKIVEHVALGNLGIDTFGEPMPLSVIKQKSSIGLPNIVE